MTKTDATKLIDSTALSRLPFETGIPLGLLTCIKTLHRGVDGETVSTEKAIRILLHRAAQGPWLDVLLGTVDSAKVINDIKDYVAEPVKNYHAVDTPPSLH